MHAAMRVNTGRALALRARRLPALDAWTATGVLALGALLFVALFGQHLAPHEPIYFVIEHGAHPRPYEPGLVFPFGSDVLGRDLLSLVLVGARATLTIVVLAGLARVAAGLVVAALGTLWRPSRVVSEPLAELISGIPATLVALILIKVVARTDTSLLVFIGALLLTGWAGPYRVVRAEIDRLSRSAFTQGALAIGVGRWRMLWRHQLPHLVPVIAINLTQQIVASLVLVAELGVLGVFVGAIRGVDISNSLAVVRTGPRVAAPVPDLTEWGGMLATSRTVEALWATRWVIFAPGLAFALTAAAIALIGFALARRYARRDVLRDLRGFGLVGLLVAAMFAVAASIPPRYSEARVWAAAARAELRPAGDLATTFRDAGLRTYTVAREATRFVRSGPATITIGRASVAEQYPRPADPEPGTLRVQSLATDVMGGGEVEAPLVFAGRGITPAAVAQPPISGYNTRPGAQRPAQSIGQLVKDYPDDYAGIDVRGKVVLLVRFLGVEIRSPGSAASSFVYGPEGESAVRDAIARGAAAVLLVDPHLSTYRDRDRPLAPGTNPIAAGGALNPYLALERVYPPTATEGVPVVVLDPVAARGLTAPLGLHLTPLLGYDLAGTKPERSASRDLGISARVAVPLRAERSSVESVVAEVPGVPDDMARVVVWAPRDPLLEAVDPRRREVLGALARVLAERRAPFVFVDFDTRADAKAVREALKHRRLGLVIVLDDVDGGSLAFRTANGELIPAFDHYADEVDARYRVTRQTANLDTLAAVTPFLGTRTVFVSADGAGDAGADASALIAYVAGRLALGAPELVR